MHKELGTITYGRMYREDRGILTFSIGMDFESGSQAFGGFALDAVWAKTGSKEHRKMTDAGRELVQLVRELLRVDTFEEAVGQKVYALRECAPVGCGPSIIGLETLDGRRFVKTEWDKKWV